MQTKEVVIHQELRWGGPRGARQIGFSCPCGVFVPLTEDMLCPGCNTQYRLDIVGINPQWQKLTRHEAFLESDAEERREAFHLTASGEPAYLY